VIESPHLRCPGLFITGTDTGVGKTTVTCAIARRLVEMGLRVGVCKPVATGCRSDREGLVSPDAEALAHFADCRLPLDVVNPLRYADPVAPAVAAETERRPFDMVPIAESLQRLDAQHDLLLVEGIGGLMVPLDESHTVADLAAWIGYPVVVVTANRLGTLNHTAMTCQLIRDRGLKLAGLVVNGHDPDSTDPAHTTNLLWLARQNDTKVLATIPQSSGVAPERAQLPLGILDAVAMADWQAICRKQCR